MLPRLPVSQIRVFKCNSKSMVKFQVAKHAHETFAAALLGTQEGSKEEARTEPAQISPEPIFHLASHLSKQDTLAANLLICELLAASKSTTLN